MSCSSDDQSDKECPLCMEPLEIDDLDFYPCKCEYQICRFCWHRLRTDENGLCPACRQPYPEDPEKFKPLSCADVQRIKDEKRLKQQAEKQRISESRKHLANYRVLQKNLVYVVGLSPRVAEPDVLRKPEFFGKYGKILKVVVGTAPSVGYPHLAPSHSAYVTYGKVDEALKAIQGVSNCQLDGRVVKASLGTTKYCSSFLRSQKCFKPDCMYLHDIAESDISFTKEDMHMGKHAEYERRLIESMLNRPSQQLNEKGRTQAWINKNVGWEGADSDYNEDGSVNEGFSQPMSNEDSPVEDPTPSEALAYEKERISTQDKENQLSRRTKTKKSTSHSSTVRQNQRSPSPSGSPPVEPIPPAPIVVHEEDTTFESESDLPVTLSDGFNRDTVEPSPTTMNNSTQVQSVVEQDREREYKLLRFLRLSEENDSSSGHALAPAPFVEAPEPLTNWKTLLGLAPQSTSTAAASTTTTPKRHQNTLCSPPPGLSGFGSDDDLGFDPFSESTKGLAMLLEEEKVRYDAFQPTRSLYHQPQPSTTTHSIRDLWSQPASMANVHQQAQAAFSTHQSTPVHHQPTPQQQHQQPHPFDMFATLSGFQAQQHQQQQAAAAALAAAAVHQQQLQQRLHQHYPQHSHQQQLHHHHHQLPPQHHQQLPDFHHSAAPGGFAPPPGLGMPPPRAPQQPQPQSLSEWQEGLKALLPNVNVRFASDLEREPQSRWSASTNSAPYGMENIGGGRLGGMPHSIPPPPGFSVPNR